MAAPLSLHRSRRPLHSHGRRLPTQTLDWQILVDGDDNAWQTIVSASFPPAPPQRRARGRRLFWLLSTLTLMAVIVAAGGTVYWADRQVTALERDLTFAVEADRWATARQTDRHVTPVQNSAGSIGESVTTLSASHRPNNVTLVDATADQVVVTVTLSPTTGSAPVQQTQVYRYTDQGWTRVTPSLSLWGEWRRRETAHLVFEYYARDEAAVAAAADRIESHYAALLSAFPLPRTRAKLTIVVDPLTPPKSPSRHLSEIGRLVTASPSQYLAPAGLTDGDLLTQAFMLSLADSAATRYVISEVPFHRPMSQSGNEVTLAWYPLAYGVRLWRLWQPDLPLAVWRQPLVHWLLDDLLHDPDSATPDFYPTMCADFGLWRVAPAQIDIAAYCESDRLNRATYRARNINAPDGELYPLLQLDYLLPQVITSDDTGDVLIEVAHGLAPHPAGTVALETVVEYAADRFGPDSIPRLLDQAYAHTSWDTLVPAVFGVSADDFQAGWHAYLVEEFDIQVEPTR